MPPETQSRPSPARADFEVGSADFFFAEYLEHWAWERPDVVAHTFIDYLATRAGVRHEVTFGELDRWTRALATRVMELTEPGDRVAILTPQGAEYTAGFSALMRTRVVGVPLYSPDLPGQGDRLQAVVADCAPSLVITTREKLEIVTSLVAEHGGLTADRILCIDDFRSDPDGLADRYAFPEAMQLDDVAYLQYTSGSTRIPAGVTLTHRNIVSNVVQLAEGYGLSFREVVTVSWLPLFHDMGLLLGIGAPIIGGGHGIVLDPVAFILKPLRWLQALSGQQHAATAAPNFAFDYAAKRISAEDRAELDLSGVKIWANGAEPILPATLERFTLTFADQGVTPEVVRPTYGLAEATVFVAVSPGGEVPWVIDVDSVALQQGIVDREISEGTRPVALVSSGVAVGQHLAIVDPDTRALLPDGKVGEIWVHGPNVGIGYWRKQEATDTLFGARLEDAGDLPATGWLRTEDLGTLIEGRVFVTGRIKDLIIIDGRNIYPHDIEYTVEESHDAIAQRRLASFSVPSPGGERLVVVAERYRHAGEVGARLDQIAGAAREAVSREHAVALSEMVLVEPDTIARTSSGKIARKATRTAYLDGTLQRVPAAN